MNISQISWVKHHDFHSADIDHNTFFLPHRARCLVTCFPDVITITLLAEKSLTRHMFIHRVNSGWTKPLPVFMQTNHISNSVTLKKNCFIAKCSVCCVQVKWHCKWSHSSSVTGLKPLITIQSHEKAIGWWTAQCIMCIILLFCAIKVTILN